MKDIHCHLLPGIDDGSKNFDESIKTIRRAQKEGITDIIITPHYIEDSKYNTNNKQKKILFSQLKRYIRSNKIDVNLYLGNEVYLTENILKLLEKEEILTLAGTRYILIEFPLLNYRIDTYKILGELLEKGYIPVIAHPERYKIYKEDPVKVVEILEMGALLQGNYESLLGKYGKEAKKTLLFFLKKGWITFLASDRHRDESYNLKKVKKQLKRILKDKKALEQFDKNVEKLLNDEEIEIQI